MIAPPDRKLRCSPSRWIADDKGEPLLVYRGEHGIRADGEVFQTRRGCLSFGNRAAAEHYARQPNDRYLDELAAPPRIFAAHIRIAKPVLYQPRDAFFEIIDIRRILGDAAAPEAIAQFSEEIIITSNWIEGYRGFDSPCDVQRIAPERADELYFRAFKLLDEISWVKRFRDRGFDGAFHGGSGETGGETEYKVFDASQVVILPEERVGYPLKHACR